MPRKIIPSTCLQCGAKFLAFPESKGTFCSQKCWYEWRKSQFLNRFWAKVNKTETCWLWTGGTNPQGYGRVYFEGKLTSAHRLSWEMAFGPIPEGMLVCHKCDVPLCVRPDDLFLGTYRDNNIDREMKHRGNHAQGARVHTAKLTTAKVRRIRALYKQEHWTQDKLAQIFGLSQSSIWYVINKKTWKHI